MGDSGSPTGLVEGEAVAEGEGHMFWFLLTRHLGEGGRTSVPGHHPYSSPGQWILVFSFLHIKKQKLGDITKVPCPRPLFSKWRSSAPLWRPALLCLEEAEGLQ